MAFALGTDVFVGVNDEDAWDTAVAPYKYLPCVLAGETLQNHREYEFAETLDGTAQSTEPHLELTYWDGDLPMQINYEGIEFFLYQLMGAESASDPVTVEANVYGRTYTPGTPLPTGLTLYVNRTTKLYKYSGGMITKGTFNIGNSGPVCTATFSMLGGTCATANVESRATKAADPGFFPYNPAMRVGASSDITVGGTSVKTKLKSATFTIENPLSQERTIFGSSIIQPQFTGKQKVTGQLVGWMDSDAYTNIEGNFENGTDSAIVITVQDSTLLGATEYRQIVFTFQSCYLGPTGTPTASSAGLIEVTFPFWAWYDTTNDQCKIELYNSDSTDHFATE